MNRNGFAQLKKGRWIEGWKRIQETIWRGLTWEVHTLDKFRGWRIRPKKREGHQRYSFPGTHLLLAGLDICQDSSYLKKFLIPTVCVSVGKPLQHSEFDNLSVKWRGWINDLVQSPFLFFVRCCLLSWHPRPKAYPCPENTQVITREKHVYFRGMPKHWRGFWS